jgi:hypothetical protein
LVSATQSSPFSGHSISKTSLGVSVARRTICVAQNLRLLDKLLLSPKLDVMSTPSDKGKSVGRISQSDQPFVETIGVWRVAAVSKPPTGLECNDRRRPDRRDFRN